MAIIRRLPSPELLFLFVGVWLCLTLDPHAAARVPTDHFVFPSESKPQLENRLEVVTRLMNASLVEMPHDTNKGMPSITSRGSETGNGNEEIKKPTEAPKQKVNLPEKDEALKNHTSIHPSSESKVITFSKDTESDGQRPWDIKEVPLAGKPNLVLEPRITLETSRICPEGFTLSSSYCRKIA